MNKIVYIGSNIDIIPIILLPDMKEFVYIDSLPRSEYGMHLFKNSDLFNDKFLPELEKILKNNDFKLVRKKPNYFEYNNNLNQTLKYFINTPFPEKITEEIKNEIYFSKNLIIFGFDPDKVILNLMPNLKNIYCNKHTVYHCPEEDFEYEENKKSLFRDLIINKKKYDYNYFLIEEKIKFEYWKNDNINKSIKNIYKITQCNTLMNFYNK